ASFCASTELPRLIAARSFPVGARSFTISFEITFRPPMPRRRSLPRPPSHHGIGKNKRPLEGPLAFSSLYVSYCWLPPEDELPPLCIGFFSPALLPLAFAPVVALAPLDVDVAGGATPLAGNADFCQADAPTDGGSTMRALSTELRYLIYLAILMT